MFSQSRRLIIASILLTLCLTTLGGIAYQNALALDLSLGVVLASLFILAFGYAIARAYSRASLCSLQSSPSATIPETNSEPLLPLREATASSNPSIGRLMSSIPAPELQPAITEWLGLGSISETDLLQKSEERYRTLLEAAPEQIFVINCENVVEFVNAFAANSFHRPASEIIGRSVSELFPPEIALRQIASLDRVRETKELFYTETATVFPTGELWIGTWLVPLKKPDGQVESVLGFSRDITDRKRAERAAAETENRLRALVEKSYDATSILDREGKAVYRTPSARRITGYSDSERSQGDLFQLIHPEDLSHAQALFTEIRGEPSRSVSAQLRMKHKDGNWRWIEVTATNHYDDASVQGIVVNYRDVTEQKEREQEVERSNEQLTALYETTRDLITVHDLPTLLQTIVARASALLSTSGGGIYLYDPSHEDLEVVAAQGSELTLGKRLKLGEGMAGRVAQTREPFILDDYRTWEGRARHYEAVSFSAVLEVPMLYRKDLLGVLIVHEVGDTRRRFTPQDARILSLFAAHAASAVNNAQLLTQTQRRAEEFRALYQTTQALSVDSNLPTILQIIVEQTAALLRTKTASIYLFDPAQNELELRHFMGFQTQAGTRLKLGDGAAGRVAQSRQPLVVEDHRTWEGRTNIYAEVGFSRVAAVPMIYRGELIGVLSAAEIGDISREFSEADIRLLSLLASQAASAVHDARLLAETTQRADQLAILNTLTATAAGAMNFHEMLQTLADRMGELFGADGCYITLWDEAKQLTLPTAAYGPLRETYPRREPSRGKQTMTQSVLDAGHALVAEDTRNSPYVDPSISARYPARSILGLPLIAGGKKLGAAIIGFNQPHQFTPEEIAFGEQAGRQVALAVAKAQLLEETRRRADELETLSQVTRDLNTFQELPALLQMILERTLQLFHSPSGAITLYDSLRGELETVATQTFPRAIGARLKLGEGLAGIAAQTREPLIVDDYSRWEHRIPEMEGVHFNAALAVPMLYRGELIGTIGIREIDNPSRKFTPADARLLSLFASQAASAVHNARLFEETKTRADQMALLYDAGLTLNRVLEPQKQLEFLLKITMKALRAHRVAFFRYDPAANALRYEGGIDHPSHVREHLANAPRMLDDERSPIAWVARNRVPLYVPDHSADPHWVVSEKEMRSTLAVPIEHEKNLLGILTVRSERAYAFMPEDERLFTLFANQVAVAMENARLFSETKRHASEMSALQDTALDLVSRLETQPLLETIVRRATDLLGSQGALLYQWEESARQLRCTLSYNLGRDYRNVILQPGEGIAGKVYQTGQSLIVNDYAQWEGRAAHLLDVPTRAVVSVPIVWDHQVIGAINVSDETGSRVYDEQDARLLSLFANQAAIAIENARLFVETKTRADQLALLYDAGMTLNRTLDPQIQLEFLVKIAMKSMQADRAVFFRYDVAKQKLYAEMSVGYSDSFSDQIKRLEYDINDEGGIPSWVYRNRSPVNVPDVTADERFIVIDPELRSGLWVPIEHDGVPRGVLGVLKTRTKAFTAQDERLLSLFSNQVSISLENSQLFEEVNRRLGELEAINQLSTALRAAQTLEEALPLFLDKTLSLFETRAGTVWLDDPASGTMHRAITRGWMEQIAELPMAPGEGIAGHVLATGEAHLSREFVSDPLTRQTTLSMIPRGWGGACVPIRSAEDTIGVLSVGVELPRELSASETHLLTTLAEIAGNTIHRMRLHESLGQTFVETVAALAHAIDARDTYTAGHSNNVSELAVELAREAGMTREVQEAIRLGGLLHDIGKIAVPDAILHKPGRLTPEEYALVKTHPRVGAQILEPIKQLEQVVPIVLSHQERFDGTGYPDGLAGDAIPIGARILAVVDAFSSITDNRSYRSARTPSEALEEINQWSGKQFDPEIVRAFQGLLKKKS